MVYSKKCTNCNKLIDFGSRDPEESDLSPEGLPENAMRFDGELYCKECVKNFVQFGTGDLQSRIEFLEEQMEEVADTLGLEKNLNS